MNKKFLAIAITALMIIGLFPALTWTPQAHAQEECDANGSPMCVFLNPGIADDFKIGWSHTLDTLWGTQDGALFPPPGSPENNAQTRQLFDNYLDYAILAKSTGDIQLDLNIVETIGGVRLYIPPEFTFLAPTIEESVWTDITNDYSFSAQVSTRWAYDTIAPGWTRISFGPDYYGTNTLVVEPGLYHIRLFNLQAPSVAGLYHIKIYYFEVNNGAFSIGAGNYPIMIVKDELNPAYIAVTVRTNLGFTPPYVSGRVTAEGTTPEGRAVSAVGYFGPNEWLGDSDVPGQTGAEYRTYLFGVAEGTYTLKAEASGFVPTTSERITVLAGQSYAIGPIVLFDSPDVTVTVWSKHGTGELPWHNIWQLPYGTNNPSADPDDTGPSRDILLELYDTNSTMVAFWASNALAAYGDTKSIPATTKLIGLHDDAPGGTIPTHTSYNAWLVDNYDVDGNLRGYPSTVWDGHVPWDTADYISGLTNGQYTVEGFVTGYIMDESDAYQRAFSLSGSAYNLQFDLRRTNWIEAVMHLPANLAVSGETTVTLTAEDAAGNERASVAFFAYPEMCDDGWIDGKDADFATASTPNWQYYEGGIVMEGWNAVFPAAGGARGDFRNINNKDYGLNPSASSHSAGAVTLAGNPYSIKLYMADMGIPYEAVAGTGWYQIVGDSPLVSVYLCNSRQLLSFSIASASVWISLRSVDFEIPSHSQPWTFPGAYVWVDFLDEAGEVADILDPTIYGLIQDAGRTNPGWDITGAAADSYGVSPFDIDNVNEAGKHERIGVTYYGTDLCATTYGGGWGFPYALVPGFRSTRLEAGQYTFNVHTFGYVMRRSFAVMIPATGAADIGPVDLIQGAQIRVTMNFNNEAVPVDFGDNGFVRVEVFNADDELVGASIYGQADPNVNTNYFQYNPFVDNLLVPGPAEGADFGAPATTFPSSDLHSNGQRANYYGYYGVPGNPPQTGLPPVDYTNTGRWPCLQPGYAVGDPWLCSESAPYAYHGWTQTQPSDANSLYVPMGGAQSFDVYGFHWYTGGPARTWAGGWPTTDGLNNPGAGRDYGLKGSNDIPGWADSGAGLYKVKVWAFQSPGGSMSVDPFAKEWRMYQMAWPLENIQVPWGGAVEVFVTMNNMATLRGSVSWLDMFGNLRALPWAQVTASPGASTDQIPAYAAGLGSTGGASETAGAYIMWLPAGSHDVSVSTSEAAQVWSSSAPTQNAQYTVVVSDGWVAGGDSRLASNAGVPVPELPAFAVPLSLFAVLAASVWLLRKRTLNVPILTK